MILAIARFAAPVMPMKVWFGKEPFQHMDLRLEGSSDSGLSPEYLNVKRRTYAIVKDRFMIMACIGGTLYLIAGICIALSVRFGLRVLGSVFFLGWAIGIGYAISVHNVPLRFME